MSRSRLLFTTVAVAALVAGCGGGGDDSPVVPPVSPYVKISAANQDAVARASFASIMPFVAVPMVGGSASPALAKTAQAGATSVLGGHGVLAHLALRVFDFGGKQATGTAGLARPLALLPPEVVPCMVSGTYTVTVDDKDNSKSLTVGDTVSITFNQCDDGDYGTVNGGMALSIATISLTPAAEDVTGSIAFQSLAITGSPYSYSVNGGATFRFTFTLKTDGEEVLSSFTVASDGMTVARQAVAAGGLSDSYSYRAGFTVSDRDFMSTVPGVPSSEIITASGDFGLQSLGGDLTLSTITPFKSVFTDPFGDILPSEGQLLVSGADGTKLRLTATQTVQVLMEMSDDSDAEWESSKFVTWDWLLS